MIKLAEFIHHPKPWGVYEFPWGAAVKHEPTQKWHKVIINYAPELQEPQEIDVSGLEVILHDNGIEFAE